ncbi:TetR family transcriptional regulator [Streptomyces sp. J2-1]|uniref:TetR/AcrR family transcriptional regulator n=1 Tax=Streptomyces corallincola TaxID=2851888 RepID=UPI001C38D5DD|nr:TetR family transcriptional regulator [Streptomyces corallincola]MBV2356486.1 TetR family transcriptional regulator [Streptomyces corallincola]
MTAAPTPPPTEPSPPGLRERKKLRTRASIRAATRALIEEDGWDAATVERIAGRAEVSPSTVLRYFPAREDIVLPEEDGTLVLDALRTRPAAEPWPLALRHALRQAVARSEECDPEAVRLRARLAAEVPVVRDRLTRSAADTARPLRTALAERTGLDPGSLEARIRSTALVGALLEASLYWADHGCRGELRDLLDRALDVVEPLGADGTP